MKFLLAIEIIPVFWIWNVGGALFGYCGGN